MITREKIILDMETGTAKYANYTKISLTRMTPISTN